MNKLKATKKHFDIAIIGSGGAGLMAAATAAKAGAKNIAIISKVIPTNSHTVAAKGGINASLGNVGEDHWQWHAFDTIKGSDYLADKDAVEILCKNANSAIIELEKMGVVFSRDQKGQIAQRAYGGQTTHNGEGGVAYRACYSKDKTGQTILHTLYNEALKVGAEFFSEFFVTDLLIKDKKCFGSLAIDLNNGELIIFESAVTIIACGGYSQIFKNTTSSLICTGDGTALVAKENLPLQDMEFIQFHPTGIAGQGFLISEAARGEGAYLLNGEGKRFMEKYDPKMMELSSRDKISRAIATEIIEGRGCGDKKNYINLDLTKLSEEVLVGRLPGIVEVAKNFAKVDVRKDYIPVAPTAHYTMGGIPTNLDCEVIDENNEVIEGLMAIGETACVSVHGANRLGCNSLLDLIVFGKICGQKSASLSFEAKRESSAKLAAQKISKLEELLSSTSHFDKLSVTTTDTRSQNTRDVTLSLSKGDVHPLSLDKIKTTLQNNNEKYLGVFRNEELLQTGFNNLKNLYVTFRNYSLKNKTLFFNDELITYLELNNLFINSFTSIYAALSRTESRGAHFRSDHPNKDDQHWHCHSLVKINDEDFVKMRLIKKEIIN